jgi:hypothetical protein
METVMDVLEVGPRSPVNRIAGFCALFRVVETRISSLVTSGAMTDVGPSTPTGAPQPANASAMNDTAPVKARLQICFGIFDPRERQSSQMRFSLHAVSGDRPCAFV